MAKNSKSTSTQTSIKVSAEGQDYLNIFLDKPWDLKNLSVKDVLKFEEDFFVQMVLTKLTRFVFIGPFVINVLDVKGNSREDIAKWFRTMLDNVNFEQEAEDSWIDVNKWGNYFYSLGIGEDTEGHTVITEIRRLPPATFENAGNYAYGYYTQGRLLHGIVRDDNGQVHYWQRDQSGVSQELQNCYHIRSNLSSDYIDGVPGLTPAYKLIPKLTFLVDGMMIANNRDNILFLQHPEKAAPVPNSSGMSIWDYLGHILKGFSRTLLHVLPYGAAIVEPQRPVSELSLKSIDMVVKWIMSLYSSSDMISKGDGTLIGGSSNYEAELAKNFSKSNQRFIVNTWTKILNQVLEWNGYAGFTVQIIPEELRFDDDNINMQIGAKVIDAVVKKGVVVGSINEVREKFGWEDADSEFMDKSVKEWKAATIKADEPPAPAPVVNPQDQTGRPASQMDPEEAADDTEGDKPDDIKSNQDKVPTREDIQKGTAEALADVVKSSFDKLKNLRV
jgi:hypothetical protein